MNAFLDAESRVERERLAALLAVINTGTQGDKGAIERLQRLLQHAD